MVITPATASDFLKSHICAHWKAPCQAHSAASHQEHAPERTQPYKCCTRASSSKHPEIQFALSPGLPLQCTTSLHLPPNLLELERSDTGMCIPRTVSPKTHTKLPQIEELLLADFYLFTRLFLSLISCGSGCNPSRKSLSPGISPRRIAMPRVPPRYGMSSVVWSTAAAVQASLAIHCRPVTFCFTT